MPGRKQAEKEIEKPKPWEGKAVGLSDPEKPR